MKRLLFTIPLLFLLVSNLIGQTSDEISELTPCPVPPKLSNAELKGQKKWKDDLRKGKIHYLPSDPIKIFVGVESKTLSNEKTVGKIKFQTNSYELVFREISKEISVATLNVFIKVISIDSKINGCFEEQIKFSLSRDEFGKKKTFSFFKIFEMPKGKYNLDFFIRCVETGLIGQERFYFEVK